MPESIPLLPGTLALLILEAAPGVVEEWEWNAPTWSQKIDESAFQALVRAAVTCNAGK